MTDRFYKYTYHEKLKLCNILLLEAKGNCDALIETLKILDGFADVNYKRYSRLRDNTEGTQNNNQASAFYRGTSACISHVTGIVRPIGDLITPLWIIGLSGDISRTVLVATVVIFLLNSYGIIIFLLNSCLDCHLSVLSLSFQLSPTLFFVTFGKDQMTNVFSGV